MQSRKLDRITEDIKREITAILRKLKDPRIQNSLISVVRVNVSNDLSICKVYVSSIEGIAKTNAAIKGLKSASGYIRREVGNNLEIRHIPMLEFIGTDAIEYSANISKILNDLNLEDIKNDKSV